MYTWFGNCHLNEIFLPTHICAFFILNICDKNKLLGCLPWKWSSKWDFHLFIIIYIYASIPQYISSFFILNNWELSLFSLHIYNQEQFFDQAYYFTEYLDCTYYTLYFNAILWLHIVFNFSLSIYYAIDSSKYKLNSLSWSSCK